MPQAVPPAAENVDVNKNMWHVFEIYTKAHFAIIIQDNSFAQPKLERSNESKMAILNVQFQCKNKHSYDQGDAESVESRSSFGSCSSVRSTSSSPRRTSKHFGFSRLLFGKKSCSKSDECALPQLVLCRQHAVCWDSQLGQHVDLSMFQQHQAIVQ